MEELGEYKIVSIDPVQQTALIESLEVGWVEKPKTSASSARRSEDENQNKENQSDPNKDKKFAFAITNYLRLYIIKIFFLLQVNL